MASTKLSSVVSKSYFIREMIRYSGSDLASVSKIPLGSLSFTSLLIIGFIVLLYFSGVLIFSPMPTAMISFAHENLSSGGSTILIWLIV